MEGLDDLERGAREQEPEAEVQAEVMDLLQGRQIQVWDDSKDRWEDGEVRTVAYVPELKGSIGEGPNQTNYSDRSSVRILSKFRNSIFA